MIKNYRLAVFGMVLSLFVSACVDDTFSDTEVVRTEGNAQIPLAVTIPDAEVIQTRTGSSGDASVNELDLLLFDNSSSSTGDSEVKLVARRSISHTATSVVLPLSSGSSRLVYVVANARSYLSVLPDSDDDALKDVSGHYKYSLADIRSMLTTELSAELDEKGFISSGFPGLPVPMSGLIKFDSGLSSTSVINVQLVRSLSKISVSTSLGASKFKIKGLTICNGAQTGSILSPSNTDEDGKGDRMGYSVTDSLLYAYPTIVGGSSLKPVSIIVEAQYDGLKQSSFYRLLISNTLADVSTGLSLMRNKHYIVKIDRVDMNGYEDLDKAMASPPSNIDYNVTVSNNYNNVTLIGGKMFALDYERLTVYADNIEQLSVATMRTDYPLTSVGQGSVTVDEGLFLIGASNFTSEDIVKTFKVNITSLYSHPQHSDSSPKGIHISLGDYHKTIEIIKKSPLDVHPVSIQLSDISELKLISSSGDTNPWWMNFSRGPVYSPFDIRTVMDNVTLQNNGYKAYVHLDENINSDYRELYFQTLSKSTGKREKHILHQDGAEKYSLGYFGGKLLSNSSILQYSYRLLIEGYEENEEPLSIFTEDNYPVNDEQKKALYAVFEDGKKSTILLADIYKSPAALYCLNKNRDVNGNGKIDSDEVLWYLPGIRQGMGIMLYQALTENLSTAYWSSSCCFNTFRDMYDTDYTCNGVYMMNTISNSTGYKFFCSPFSEAVKKKCNIRCVRDL